ncbi:MAG TPA: OFA family MFS transporter [Bryobacteraceae bacterium]|nr:OFA family MFS transporter [Bryobacteraceae bacterium]
MTTNRWLIAIAGIFMQVALGAVYAWSVFRIPLTKAHGWTISQVTLVFQVTIFIVGFASFAGGLWMRRSGPRPVAMTAAILYGAGTMLAGMVSGLTALYLTYGVIAGAGLGFGYIVPIATLVKWFPDKRGLITGLAVAGFGSGALVTAPVANSLISSVGVGETFVILGAAYLVIVLICASAMRNPPAGYAPAGYHLAAAAKSRRDFSFQAALSTWQWYALWFTLFLNTTAGISIISQASPMAQEISGVSAATAAGLVGLISIANGSGRFLWAWLSDAIGRRTVFLTMFLLQAVLFYLLAGAHDFGVLSALACGILLCYGGGFGTMPAFVADYFGSAQIAPIYGAMVTAWGFAAAFGPTLVASIREATGRYEGSLRWLAIAMLASTVLPLLLRAPKEV